MKRYYRCATKTCSSLGKWTIINEHRVNDVIISDAHPQCGECLAELVNFGPTRSEVNRAKLNLQAFVDTYANDATDIVLTRHVSGQPESLTLHDLRLVLESL